MGESLIAQLCRTRAWSQHSPTSISLDAPTLEGLERMGKKSAAKLLERDREVEVERRVAAALRAGHPARRRARRAGAGRSLRIGRRDDSGASLEELQQVREIGPVLAASVRSWFDEPAQPRADRTPCAQPGVTTDRRAQGARRPGRSRWPGKTFVITGTLDGDVARRGAGADRSAGRQGDGLGQQEDELSSWSGRMPGASSRKRARWASPTLDEPAFLKLIMWEK